MEEKKLPPPIVSVAYLQRKLQEMEEKRKARESNESEGIPPPIPPPPPKRKHKKLHKQQFNSFCFVKHKKLHKQHILFLLFCKTQLFLGIPAVGGRPVSRFSKRL